MTAVFKPLPPRDAIAAMRLRGATLSPSFAWQDVWMEEHQKAFTVAKSVGFDILGDIRDALEDALADGTTLRDFEGRLRPVLEAKGWWGKQDVADPLTGDIVNAQLGSSRRLKTIFETNLRTAYAQGHWARFERDKKDRPWLRYVALLDGRTRPEHAARHNVCLPVDHPFWKTWAPPNGWGCRCTLQSLSDRDVEQLRRDGVPLNMDPAPDRLMPYVNPRTGEAQAIPAGIDPGWAYNPGEISLTTANVVSRSLAASPGMTDASLKAMPSTAREEAFRRWITAILEGVQVDIDAMPAGRLADKIAATVGATDDEAWVVMHQAVVKRAAEAATVDPRILLRAPRLMAQSFAVLRDRATGELHFLVGRDDDNWTRIVVRSGTALGAKGRWWRREVLRAVVTEVDQAPLDAYPNPARFDLLQGEI